MSRLDQAKLALKIQKAKRQLKREIIEVEGGDGAVVVEITGAQKMKKIHIDPDRVDLAEIEQLEDWLVEAVGGAISQSQQLAAQTIEPYLKQLGMTGS